MSTVKKWVLARLPRGRAAVIVATVAFSLAAASKVAVAQAVPMTASTIDPNGLTAVVGAPYGRAFNGESFQFDALTSFAGYQYAAYWAQDDAAAGPERYYVAIARRKLPDGPWDVARLRDSVMKHALDKAGKPSDVHNTISLGIAPGDGTIHIAYDHHNHPLRYRMTPPGTATRPGETTWTAELFQAERSTLDTNKPVTVVSYPSFTRTPDGGLMLTMRRGQSGDGAWWLYAYDAKTHKWTTGHQYDDGRNATYDATTPPSAERCAYPNGWTFGPDGTLHVSYVYRENFGKGKGGNGTNHDIYYAQSPDGGRTWKNTAGDTVSSIDGKAVGGQATPKQFSLASPGMRVVELDQTSSLMNEQTQAVDSRGGYHMLLWHRDPAKAKPPLRLWDRNQCSYFLYSRSPDGKWTTAILPGPVGTRARLGFDAADNLYAVYSVPKIPTADGGLRFDDGQLVVARATAAKQWSDWTTVATWPGPCLGEPTIDVPRLRDDSVLSVFVQDFPTADGQATPVRVLDFDVKR